MNPTTPEAWITNASQWLSDQTKNLGATNGAQMTALKEKYGRLMWAAALREGARIGLAQITDGLNPSSTSVGASVGASVAFGVAREFRDTLIKRAEELEK